MAHHLSHGYFTPFGNEVRPFLLLIDESNLERNAHRRRELVLDSLDGKSVHLRTEGFGLELCALLNDADGEEGIMCADLLAGSGTCWFAPDVQYGAGERPLMVQDIDGVVDEFAYAQFLVRDQQITF